MVNTRMMYVRPGNLFKEFIKHVTLYKEYMKEKRYRRQL